MPCTAGLVLVVHRAFGGARIAGTVPVVGLSLEDRTSGDAGRVAYRATTGARGRGVEDKTGPRTAAVLAARTERQEE